MPYTFITRPFSTILMRLQINFENMVFLVSPFPGNYPLLCILWSLRRISLKILSPKPVLISSKKFKIIRCFSVVFFMKNSFRTTLENMKQPSLEKIDFVRCLPKIQQRMSLDGYSMMMRRLRFWCRFQIGFLGLCQKKQSSS